MFIVADRDDSGVSCSMPTTVASSLRADGLNVKKKHRRMKSTSRGSDLCVDAGKYHFRLLFERLNKLHVTLFIFSFYFFTAIFPSGPGLARIRMSPFWILSELGMVEVMMTTGAIGRAELQSKHHPTFYMPDSLPVAHPTV